MQKNMMNDDVKNSRNGIMKAFYEVTVDFPTSSELELPEFSLHTCCQYIHRVYFSFLMHITHGQTGFKNLAAFAVAVSKCM